MASSKPFTSQRPNTISMMVNIYAQASSPLKQEIPRNNEPIFKMRPKDYNLWFDGKEVERFFKRVENIAEIEGASGRDIERQISFWTKDQDISYHIEGMPRYETGNWEKLKLEMKRIWGTVSPERRYKISPITHSFINIQQGGGIGNMTQYKKFFGEYESNINYLKSYQYIQGDINHNREILASLSSIVQESIYLEAKVLIQQKEFSKEKSQEKRARFEEESWEEVLKKMKDITHKAQNTQPLEHQSKDTGKESAKEVLKQLKHLSEVAEYPKSRYPLPPISSSCQPYVPAQMTPRQLLKCYYWLEEGNSAIRCNHLTEDLEKRIVLRRGGTYLFPNFQRVPTEGSTSAKELVKRFSK
ncbi:hypothetical protein O181_023777 [Austropuccinia psidii MF-1]|uniref:Uncharacterized protein n=1 Tax=Austropuccinia psidii MF-1 TaxID=1389203 RepID=A0A9Q3GYB9_9BASI|nr:hypothetical protein [Austropuccinia psidii MF-1]